MNTAIIVALIGVIGSIIGVICTLIKGNRQDKASFDFISKELSEKHTSEKAYSYYINTKNDISKITKEVIEARKDIDKNHYDMKERIDKTWTNVNNSSTELKVLSNNLNSYLNSINNAKSDDTNLINALNTVQNFVYETGKKNLEIDKLKNINNKLTMKNNDLKNENLRLKTEIDILKNKIIELENHQEINHDDISL